jgi:hypothetical protein
MYPVLRAPTAPVLTANFSVTSLTTTCKSSPDTSQVLQLVHADDRNSPL